jgi:hypothetical protein
MGFIERRLVDDEVVETDLQILNRARNRCAYAGNRNALVEWTMSDAWTTPATRSVGECPDVSGELGGA